MENQYVHSSTKTLLILDGFDALSVKDELRDVDGSTTFIKALYDFLDPESRLLKCTRLVTTRPDSLCCLKEIFNLYTLGKEIEVIGFSNERIQEYFSDYFSNDQFSAKILSDLKDTKQLYELMKIPFYRWCIANILEDDPCIFGIGRTRTTLYSQMLSMFLCNHGFRKNNRHNFERKIKLEGFKHICVYMSRLVFQSLEGNYFAEEEDIYMNDTIRKSGLVAVVTIDGEEVLQLIRGEFKEFFIALHVYLKGIPCRPEYGNFVASFLAGFIGAGLKNSRSPKFLKKFVSCFERTNSMSHVSDYVDCKLSGTQIEVLEIIYEYQNPFLEENMEICIEELSLIPFCRSKVHFEGLCEASEISVDALSFDLPIPLIREKGLCGESWMWWLHRNKSMHH